jgi:tetratricopeptide (TPR) repeat protein
MKSRKQITWLAIVLLLASALVAACSGVGGATPTEVEIVIDPSQLQPDTPTPAPPTNTPQPTFTPTVTPEGPTLTPTITNTLDPYQEHITKGLEHVKNEEYDLALAEFNEAIKLDANNPEGYYHRGRTFTSQGKYDEAVVEFNFAINKDPNYEEAYVSRGVAWAQKGQINQAITDFSKAIELNPEYAPAYTNRAIANMDRDRDAAVADFSKAIELEPDNPEGYFNRGQAYIILANADSALADFETFVLLAPDDPEAYYNRAQALVMQAAVFESQGQTAEMSQAFERAVADYTQAITLNPDFVRSYLLRGIVLSELGRTQEAISDFQKVLEIGEDPELKQEAQKGLDAMLKVTPGPTATP